MFAARRQALVNGTHVLRDAANGSLVLYLDETGRAESGASLLRTDFVCWPDPPGRSHLVALRHLMGASLTR